MPGGWGTAGFATGFSRGLGDVFSPYLMYMLMSQEGKAKRATMQEQELLRRTLAGKGGPTPEVLAGMGKAPPPQMGVLPPDMQGAPPSLEATRGEYWRRQGAGTPEERELLMGISRRARETQQQAKMKEARGIWESYAKNPSMAWLPFSKGHPIAHKQIFEDLQDRLTASNQYVAAFEGGLEAATQGKPIDSFIGKMFQLQNKSLHTVNLNQLMEIWGTPGGLEKIQSQLKKAKNDLAISNATMDDEIRKRKAEAETAEITAQRKRTGADVLLTGGMLGPPTEEEVAGKQKVYQKLMRGEPIGDPTAQIRRTVDAMMDKNVPTHTIEDVLKAMKYTEDQIRDALAGP